MTPGRAGIYAPAGRSGVAGNVGEAERMAMLGRDPKAR